ncbi:adenylate/guanylate cyclase with integral membrane sensor [Pelomyxa schiedti]|nr:adenylate/guanylate cyclase with integral membrane sensor [Pelomyxa schiedti]
MPNNKVEPSNGPVYGDNSAEEEGEVEYDTEQPAQPPRTESTATTTTTTNSSQCMTVMKIPDSVFAAQMVDEYRQELVEDLASMKQAKAITKKGSKKSRGTLLGAYDKLCPARITVPFSLILMIASVIFVVVPCSIVWATSYQKAQSSVGTVSNSLVESLSKNVHDIVAGMISEVDVFLSAEIEWLKYREIDMNSYPQWEAILRPRYAHLAQSSLAGGAIYLRSPNVTLVCYTYNITYPVCARKKNASDALNFYYVDPFTNEEGGLVYGALSTVKYNSYGKLYADDVWNSMVAGKPDWGKVVTALMPAVAMASYYPYMSPSGTLLGVVQRSYSVRGLSDSLREIASGKNVIYVTTQDGFLLGTSNGSVVTVDSSGYDQPVRANSSDNPVVAAIARQIDFQGGCGNASTEMKNIRIDVNGSTYTIAIAHIPAGQRIWCGFSAIPSSEMMKTIEDGTRDSIIVFVCSIVISIALALVLAILLVSPLRHLTKDMQNLSKLRFKPVGKTVSVFTELHSMLRDYMAMKQGIHAFSRYVSAGVVRQLLDGNDKMSSLYLERHNVTVVFMDIVGFTSLCEKLAPSTLVTLMSVFMQRMCQVLIAEGATVDKFIGDCIMSFWNHPHPCEDHAFRAVQAVIKCFEELDKMNQENVQKVSLHPIMNQIAKLTTKGSPGTAFSSRSEHRKSSCW